MAKRKDKRLVVWDEEKPGHIVIWTDYAVPLAGRARRIRGVHKAFDNGYEMSAYFDPRYDPKELRRQILSALDDIEAGVEAEMVTCPTCDGLGEIPKV